MHGLCKTVEVEGRNSDVIAVIAKSSICTEHKGPLTIIILRATTVLKVPTYKYITTLRKESRHAGAH